MNKKQQKNYLIIGVVVVVFFVALILIFNNGGSSSNSQSNVIKIGYIGAMTGPVAKYGSYEAVTLAVEDINKDGGINGKPIKLIAEDGKCNAKEAINAVDKLIYVDKVKIIAGGHCSPESIAIAPIVEKNKVIMLASITSSPVLTNMGDYVFRTSPISIVQSKLMANLAYNKLHLRKMAIIYEQKDYAMPIAKKMKEEFKKYGGTIPIYEGYAPGTTDFRTILTKAKYKNVDSLFISAQSPDAALNFMKQVKEMNITVQIFGNDVAGIPLNIEKEPKLYGGLILASPDFNVTNPKTKNFIKEYKAKYGTDLPYGFWTAESYDAIFILADAVKKCGENNQCIKDYLYNIKGYEGVSGKISIDKNGDGIRAYSLRIVKNGKIIQYQ